MAVTALGGTDVVRPVARLRKLEDERNAPPDAKKKGKSK